MPFAGRALSDASVGQRKAFVLSATAHFTVVSHLVSAKFVLSCRRRRPSLEDHSPRQAVVSLQDTPVLSVLAMTHKSRHSVVAPVLGSPLSTDTRRSTVGLGTREDYGRLISAVEVRGESRQGYADGAHGAVLVVR